MKKAAGLLSIIFLLFSSVINAQGYAAIPTLGFNPDPQSWGLGMSGVSSLSNDPLAFYSNPAALGYSGQTNNFSLQFYPQKVKWGIGSQATFNNTGLSAGYNFSKLLNGLNLSAGIGFISSKFDYGWNYTYSPVTNTNTYYNSFDQYNAYGIGVSLDYFVNLSLGLTYKRIDSKLGPLPNEEARLNAIDWGVLLNVPVSKLAAGDCIYKPFDHTELKPVVNLSIGYSRSNIGNEVYYIDASQKDPLPLTAKLGYTLSFGADLSLNTHSINFFTYDIIIEAEDLLIKPVTSTSFSYQGLLGDIKPWQNLFEWKGSQNVTIRKGQKLSLLETVSFLNGSYYSGSTTAFSTDGVIVSSNGIFKLLSWNFNDNQYIKFFLEHFELQYFRSTWIAQYSSFQSLTNMQAISVSFNRFAF